MQKRCKREKMMTSLMNAELELDDFDYNSNSELKLGDFNS